MQKKTSITPRVVAAKVAPRVESRIAPINRRNLVAKEMLSKTEELHALAATSVRKDGVLNHTSEQFFSQHCSDY